MMHICTLRLHFLLFNEMLSKGAKYLNKCTDGRPVVSGNIDDKDNA